MTIRSCKNLTVRSDVRFLRQRFSVRFDLTLLDLTSDFLTWVVFKNNPSLMDIRGPQISRNHSPISRNCSSDQIPWPGKPVIKLYKISLVFKNKPPLMDTQGPQVFRNHSPISRKCSSDQIPWPRKPLIKLYTISLVCKNNFPLMKVQGSQIFRYPLLW